MRNAPVKTLRLTAGTIPNQSMPVSDVVLVDASNNPLDVDALTGTTTFAPVTTATAIGTAAKTTTSPEPPANSLVLIKFTNGNSAASPTVAFNGGTARNILLGGTAPLGAEATLAANGVGLFFFDGTALHQAGVLS